MDEMEQKLVSCFSAVLPELSADEIPQVSAANAPGWDSVTTVSLIAVIEDEFGIAVEIDDLSQFGSFQGILGYLRGACSPAKMPTDIQQAEA